jgi:hypothetical protein
MHRCVKKHRIVRIRDPPVLNFSYVGIRDPPVPNNVNRIKTFVRIRESSVLSFLERLQPIIAAAMCTIVINVLEPGAFNPESQ